MTAMRLLQISDPHFGTERPEVVQALLRLARELAPQLVLLSGDVTQRATRTQFAAARGFLDALQADALRAPALLALPGNHDVPLFDLFTRALAPYRRWREAFGAVLEPEWDGARLQLTTVKTTRRWRHKHGRISAAQIERVAQRLRGAAPGQLRVVAAHHPLAVPVARERGNLVRGHAAALQAWAEAGADLVLGGHIHLPALIPVHTPARARPLWVALAGTAVSSRVRHEADNSVNLLEIDAAGARLQRWDWTPAAGAFVPAAARALD